MASHSKIALWAGSNAACPQGSPTTDSFKATLNKSQVSTRRASWFGDVCGVANPHMARICALRRLPHSGRATIAVPVQRNLTQDPTRGDEWHSKQRFDTVLWFERMMIFFALPSCQNYASTQHSGLASPPGQ